MLHNVKIVSLDDAGHCEIYVDDHKLSGVTGINTYHAVGEVPEVDIELSPLRADISTLAELEMHISIDDIQSAISCIQFNLKLDKDFREAVLYGINNVINNSTDTEGDIAEQIMNRIFGLD